VTSQPALSTKNLKVLVPAIPKVLVMAQDRENQTGLALMNPENLILAVLMDPMSVAAMARTQGNQADLVSMILRCLVLPIPSVPEIVMVTDQS
jgi:hypothetical protein